MTKEGARYLWISVPVAILLMPQWNIARWHRHPVWMILWTTAWATSLICYLWLENRRQKRGFNSARRCQGQPVLSGRIGNDKRISGKLAVLRYQKRSMVLKNSSATDERRNGGMSEAHRNSKRSV